jgi:hypothetical protein
MSVAQVGLPKELHSELDFQLPAGITATPVKIVPSNVSSVVSPVSSSFTGTDPVAIGMNAQDIIFELPAGQGASVFVDHRYTTLSFRATYEVVSAGTSQTVSSAFLRSHCMSWFDQATTYGQNGVVLDSINNVGLVADTLLQLETDIAKRDCLSMAYGLSVEASGSSSQNNNQGHSISGFSGTLAVGSARYSYCVPLINSLIGKDAKRFFPIGSTNKLQFVLRTSSVAPLTIIPSGGSGATVRITLDQFALNMCLVDVGAEGLKMIGRPELQYFNGTTYRVSSSTLPAGSGGQLSVLTGIKGSSVRSIITRCSDNVLTTAGSCNGMYDSKALLGSLNYNIGGQRIPSNPVDFVRAPATAFMTLQESNQAFNSYDFNSGIIPQQFCIYSASSNVPSDKDIYITSSTTSATSLASWMFGYNLEKVSKSGILDGTNCNASQVYFEANTGSSLLTNANTLYFIAKMDIIYILDSRTGEVSVRQ